jgi:hypothetical protein
VVETLVDQLSNPVAFASAPLNEDDVPTPYHQKLLLADGPDQDNSMDTSLMMESFFLVPDTTPNSMAASTTTTIPTTANEETLQTENEQLKHRVEQLSRRIQSLEKVTPNSIFSYPYSCSYLSNILFRLQRKAIC